MNRAMRRHDDPLRPLPPREFGFWGARNLLFRAGFGGTREAIEQRHFAEQIAAFHEGDY